MTAAAARAPVRLVVFLAAGAMLGKALGFVRELLMARTFGATVVADSFRGSITAVLLPLTPLLNESTNAILIPMCREWLRAGRGPREVAHVVLALGLTAATIMAFIEIGAAWWVSLILGGFGPEAQQLAVEFVRIMALMMPAAVVVNCLVAADVAHGATRIAALRAAVVNVFVTTGIVLYTVTGTLGVLPLSFALSFNALAAWGLWLLGSEGKIAWTGISAAGVAVAWLEFMRRLRPLLALPFVEQLHGWTERLVASGLMIGTMASLDYARTLTESAALIVAQPIGMAVLYKGAQTGHTRSVKTLTAAILAVSLPASLFIAIFAHDIVSLVFQRGAFDETAVLLTSGSLRSIAAGLWAATLGMILIRLLNNAGRNGLAALLLGGAFLANAGMSLVAGYIAGPGGYGSQWLGAGEAVRGIVLLMGVAIALRLVKSLALMLLISLAPLLVMAPASLWVVAEVDGLMLRIVSGGVLAAMTSIAIIAALEPSLAVRTVRRAAITLTRGWASRGRASPRSEID